MGARINRQWRLVTRPTGLIKESDFEWREEPVLPKREFNYDLNLSKAFLPFPVRGVCRAFQKCAEPE